MTDSQFPTNIDTPVDEATLAASTLSAIDGGSTKHSGWMRRIDTAVTALETKVGIDSSADTASLDYRISQLASFAQDVRESVRVATTGNITLSGTQTIDGVSVVAGDRVLVKSQTTGSANGIYVVASGAWSRATDADTSGEVTPGLLVFVTAGTANGSTGWILTTPAPITLGTTSLTFQQFAGVQNPLPVAKGGTGAQTQTAAFDALAPSTTKGDLVVRGTSANVRLGVGTNGQVLTADSTATNGVKWAAAGSSAWSAVPAWIAPYGCSSTYADHATYQCVATGPGDSTGVATDSNAIRALALLGPLVFLPGTIYLNTATSNGYRAGIFAASNCPLDALIPGTSTLAFANSVVTGQTTKGFFSVIANASIDNVATGAVDDRITIRNLTIDGRASSQGSGTHDVWCGITIQKATRVTVEGCTIKNARGSASGTTEITGPWEQWGLQINTCKWVTVKDCDIYSDAPTTYGATGVGVQYCDIVALTRVIAHDNRYHGLGTHGSDNVTWTDCHGYANLARGGHCENSRDVRYASCTFGGLTQHLRTYFDTPANTSRGNGAEGIVVEGSDSVLFSNCTFSGNTNNLHIDGTMTGDDSAGLTHSVLVTNTRLRNATGYNANLIGGSSLTTKFVNVRCTGAGTRDFYVADTLYGTSNPIRPGAFDLSGKTGGVIPIAKNPTIPVAGATIQNQFPFTMGVTVKGGNNVNLAVDGVTNGSSTFAIVEPGSIIGLGSYTGTPTWTWSVLS